MDRLQSMRVFQHVVDEAGFAAAARKLDLDPAVVTRLVSDLEKHLGARLLQRSTRRLALTPAGEEYLGRLRGILADIDEADANVQAHTRLLGGRLRILAPPVIATHLLAPAVASFHRQHPDIVLDVRVVDLPDPPVEEYDLTLASGDAALPADAVVRVVTQGDAVFCAAPSYLKRHGTPRVLDDLHRHRLLRLRPTGARLGPLRVVQDAAGGEVLLDVREAMVADHTDTLLRATLDGAGISSQAEDIVAPFLNRGELRRVLAPWITNRLRVVAALPSRKFMPARTRAFLEHLVEHTRAGAVRPKGTAATAPARAR